MPNESEGTRRKEKNGNHKRASVWFKVLLDIFGSKLRPFAANLTHLKLVHGANDAARLHEEPNRLAAGSFTHHRLEGSARRRNGRKRLYTQGGRDCDGAEEKL